MQFRINHRDGEFFVRFGPEAARLSYSRYGNQMVIKDVSGSGVLMDKGAGPALMRAAEGFAVKNGLRIVAECAFAERWLGRK